jgi:riboflavin kinase/FMN adenylyltransferase
MPQSNSLQPFNSQQSVITIGSFDGVHLGHQQLFRLVVDHARENGLQSVVVTFWPLPALFFKRVPPRYTLTSPEERMELIKKTGVDRVITLDFNQQLASLDARAFLQILKGHTRFSWMFTGPDFALGKDRLGDIAALKTIGAQMDFQLEVITPQLEKKQVVSSSQIRQDLLAGRIRDANRKLGHHFMLPGKVVHGENRGSKLGFPTANLEISPERLIPGNGVYVTRAWMTESDHQSVTNIGIRPTFENPLPAPRVEPHILDLDRDLYDSEITLEFIDFIRPEKKFADVKKLISQIKKDIKKARKVFWDEE